MQNLFINRDFNMDSKRHLINLSMDLGGGDAFVMDKRVTDSTKDYCNVECSGSKLIVEMSGSNKKDDMVKLFAKLSEDKQIRQIIKNHAKTITLGKADDIVLYNTARIIFIGAALTVQNTAFDTLFPMDVAAPSFADKVNTLAHIRDTFRKGSGKIATAGAATIGTGGVVAGGVAAASTLGIGAGAAATTAVATAGATTAVTTLGTSAVVAGTGAAVAGVTAATVAAPIVLAGGAIGLIIKLASDNISKDAGNLLGALLLLFSKGNIGAYLTKMNLTDLRAYSELDRIATLTDSVGLPALEINIAEFL